MPFDPSSSNVPSCSCPLIRFPLVLPCAGFEEVSWSWSRAGGQRIGFLIHPKAQVLFLIGDAIAWGGEAVSRGQVLFVRSSTTSSSRRQCDGGGGSGLFSDSDSFYQLCQLSALSASILGLPEQPTRGRGC